MQNEEINCRNDLIHHIQEIVKAKWPNAVVQSFGSYPAGLSTFLSDIDITILEISDDLQRNLYSSNISISNNKWNNDVEILSTDVHVVHVNHIHQEVFNFELFYIYTYILGECSNKSQGQ